MRSASVLVGTLSLLLSGPVLAQETSGNQPTGGASTADVNAPEGTSSDAPSADAAPKEAVKPAPKVETVAVLELKSQGIDSQLMTSLTELLVAEAGKIEGYQILSRNEVKEMVGFEIEKQSMGCDDPKCFVEMGDTLGTDLLITGSVGKVGSTHVVAIQLIDLRATRGRNRVGETLPGDVELLPAYMRMAAWQLFGQPVPKQLVTLYGETKARLASEAAKREGGMQRMAQAERDRAAAERARAEADKARAEAEKLKIQRLKRRQVNAKPPRTWHKTARAWSMTVGILGVLAGGGLHAYSFIKGLDFDEVRTDGGRTVFSDTQVNAKDANDFQDYAMIGYIVGGTGILAAIVFEILAPSAPKDANALRLEPTGNGLALHF